MKYRNLVLILGLAAILRLLGILSRPIWYDEAFSILLAGQSVTEIVSGSIAPNAAGSAAEPHPVAYYLMLKPWLLALGESISASRLFSLLPGIGTVALAYWFVRDTLDEKTALLAAALVAVSPFQIHYSQEIRMYSWMGFWLLLAALCLAKGSARGPRAGWWWTGFALSAALAQYTHTLSAFFLLPLALTPVFRRDLYAARNTFLSGLGAVLLYSPWLVQLPSQFSKLSTGYWTRPPTFGRVITTLLSFVTNLPLPDALLPFGLFIALLVLTLSGWQTFRAVRARIPNYRKGLWYAYLAFVPPALLFLFSQWQPVYIERALLTSGLFFLVWVAWAMRYTKFPRTIQWSLLALLLVGMVLGVREHLTYQGFPYGAVDQINETIAVSLHPGDRVVHSNKLTMFPSFIDDPSLPHRYVADPPGSSSDTLAPATQAVFGLIAEPSIQSASLGANRVFFVIFDRAIQEYRDAGFATHPQLEWLESNYERVNLETWGDLHLYEYGD